MEKITPTETINELCKKLSFIKELNGHYCINYYNDNGTTIHSVYLPNGLCVCSSITNGINDYEYFDCSWNDLSEYTKTMVLLEVADKYFKQNKND